MKTVKRLSVRALNRLYKENPNISSSDLNPQDEDTIPLPSSTAWQIVRYYWERSVAEGKDPTPVARAYASYLHLDNLGTAPEVISTLFKQMPNIFNLERKLKSSDS